MSALRALFVVVAAVLAAGTAVDAHPLGNFTINHLSRLAVATGGVHVRYVADLAEIPAFAELRRLDTHASPAAPALSAWALSTAAADLPHLHLGVDGRDLVLQLTSARASTAPGAAGLKTLRLEVEASAPLAGGAHVVAYRDETYPDRLGWRDVVLGDAVEPTHELHVYPPQLIGSPRTRTSLAVAVDAAGIAHLAREPGVASVTGTPSLARNDPFAELLGRDVSSPLLILGALLTAIALGALHALEPGHGKTLLAISLVGARATVRQAIVLATSLTVAHTAGVIALGLAVLTAARWFVPERIYPWVTLGSGLVVAIVAARALATQTRRARGFDHAHVHVHDRAHPHAHPHRHGARDDHHLAQAAFAEHDRQHALGVAHDHGANAHGALDDEAHARLHAIPGTAPLTFRAALIAAVTGNIAPCPAALVVLLAAIATHRIAFGLALIVAFSFGLAGILTGLGIAVVRGAAWLSNRPSFDRVAKQAPFVTAGVIALVGSIMLGQGLVEQGVSWPLPAIVALVLAAIAGYALMPAHMHRAEVTA